VIKLFGTCHVGKRYFACEYAGNGDLGSFLRRQRDQQWQKLHQVALGLQYLHGQNIVHNDLKCDNNIIGANNGAKIIDFGLSCIPNSAETKIDTKHVGAVQWKLPEYLRGDRLSVASDVYAFNITILEAVSGEWPWGQSAMDGVVRFWVRRGDLLKGLERIDGSEGALVKMMCASDSSKCVSILFVVEKFYELVRQEEAAMKVTTRMAPGGSIRDAPRKTDEFSSNDFIKVCRSLGHYTSSGGRTNDTMA
jgi:serine/threonine protein kinase